MASKTRKYLHWVLTFPLCMCFFCLALEFWNHTWVTLLLRPVIWAILSRSWPSGLESSWKLACNTCSCSSVKVVRTLFALFLWKPSASQPSGTETNTYHLVKGIYLSQCDDKGNRRENNYKKKKDEKRRKSKQKNKKHNWKITGRSRRGRRRTRNRRVEVKKRLGKVYFL